MKIRIEHVAIWTKDLERLRRFYENYFGGRAGEKYQNRAKNFTSYFITFDGECRLELMHMPGVPDSKNDPSEQFSGIVHIAISVGSEDKVDSLTERLRNDGHTIIGEPRRTGDGYYESVVLDPEGNRIEITA